MHEAAFLKQNAEKWRQFEELLHGSGTADADRLAALFVEVTDDLSFARTFYPDSRTTKYLNGLAAEVHARVYKNRREDRARFVTFWTREVPEALYEARRALLVSAIVFLLALGIGVISAARDDGFARLILGDEYVNMTLENIEGGDPMAVYKRANELDMFLAITFNNVRVSFYAFAMGLLASFGTAYVLLQNGVMLGAFHTLFYLHGRLGASLLVVYIHGTLEISAIIIAGAAGITMGNAILFPGTYSRGASFMRGARRGLKIVIGLVPVFLVAGFLEGFVTRRTGMPPLVSVMIIAASLTFILGYFVWYPARLNRRTGHGR